MLSQVKSKAEMLKLKVLEGYIRSLKDSDLYYSCNVIAEALLKRLKKAQGTICWEVADSISAPFHDLAIGVRAPETGAYWNRYVPKRSEESFQLINQRLEIESWAEKTVLDLGCGNYVPASLSLIALLNGARKCYAVDPTTCINPKRATMAYMDLAKEAFLYPENFIFNNAPYYQILDSFKKKGILDMINNNNFYSPETENPYFQLKHCPVDNVDIPDNTLDVAWSFSVLEHILDLKSAFQKLAAITCKGGRHFHTIDFTDHRRYVEEDRSPWDFLLDEYCVDLNRLRYSDIAKLAKESGFKIIKYEVILKEEPPQGIYESIHQKFKHYPIEELSILNAHLVIEKI